MEQNVALLDFLHTFLITKQHYDAVKFKQVTCCYHSMLLSSEKHVSQKTSTADELIKTF